jgi:Na+-driven multidrug efflux pump
MKDKRNNEVLHNDGRLIAGFLGTVLLTIPIVIRLAYGDGTTWDWFFLVLGAGLATYWIVLAFRGRRIRRQEVADLERG